MTMTIRLTRTIGFEETNTIGYYVLFFIHLGSRKIHIAGVTPHPNEAWMVQVARNVTMEAWASSLPGST